MSKEEVLQRETSTEKKHGSECPEESEERTSHSKTVHLVQSGELSYKDTQLCSE